MLSQITATFSVGLCVKSEGSTVCQTTETHTVNVVGIVHMLWSWGSAGSTGSERCLLIFPSMEASLFTVYEGVATTCLQWLHRRFLCIWLLFLFCCWEQNIPRVLSPFMIHKAIKGHFNANYSQHEHVFRYFSLQDVFFYSLNCNQSINSLVNNWAAARLAAHKRDNKSRTMATSIAPAQLCSSFCVFRLFLRRNIKLLA